MHTSAGVGSPKPCIRPNIGLNLFSILINKSYSQKCSGIPTDPRCLARLLWLYGMLPWAEIIMYIIGPDLEP